MSTITRADSEVLHTPVLRTSQFDAAQVDERILSKLKNQLKNVFSCHSGFFSKFEPELMACIHLCVWRFSIWMDKPTPGSALKGLRYRDEGAFQEFLKSGKVTTGLEGPGLTYFQKFGFLITMVILPYGLARLQAFVDCCLLPQTSWLHRTLVASGNIHTVANYINTLVFLSHGCYHSLINRLLRARLVHQKPNIFYSMSSDALNRQLVWDEFLELLLVLLPLFRRISNFPFLQSQSKVVPIKGDACSICAAKPIIIHYITEPCGHHYCYYCLKTRYISNRSFHCVACNTKVTGMHYYDGGIQQ